jgi:RNA polymerase sigma-70 factor (ECF subfamily)
MTESEKNIRKLHIDEEAFEMLYRRYYPRLYNFSLKITGEESVGQDIVHEVFIKFWENRNNIEGNCYGALLFKMTRNMCFNYLKHLKVVENKNIELKSARQWEELYRIEFVRDDPYLLIEKELEEQFSEIVNDLPERCRKVFILSRVDGMKNREIALELNLSIKAIEKHISYALRILRGKFMLPVLIQLFTFFHQNRF